MGAWLEYWYLLVFASGFFFLFWNILNRYRFSWFVRAVILLDTISAA